jgi:uncharacterized membrane protein YsdA (DUF1294 family)
MITSLALAYYLIINVATFFVYWKDKSAAQHGRWRTRESVLLTLSLFGGALGGLMAMVLIHHKTRKPIFWIVNITGIAVHLYILFRLL